jgi:hypothetical protein
MTLFMCPKSGPETGPWLRENWGAIAKAAFEPRPEETIHPDRPVDLILLRDDPDKRLHEDTARRRLQLQRS